MPEFQLIDLMTDEAIAAGPAHQNRYGSYQIPFGPDFEQLVEARH